MDPRILSHELAPVSWSAWWKQRTRWAQGWFEVSLRHCRPLLVNRRLSLVQKRGVAFLLAWRVLHPFLALQLLPLVVAMAVASREEVKWDLLFFLVSALFVNGVPVLQAIAANRLGPPGIGRRPWLFVRYVLLSLVGYAELRMSVTRGSAVRHLLGAHSWDVTARGERPATAVLPVSEPVLEVAL
jgi:cellulose synthase/poly-beta-1,6-N-acetylglucosamine synthase-like glycosyltransferase